MRIAPWWVAGLALALTASAQERAIVAQRAAWVVERDKQVAIKQRAFELRPRRQDTPLRYLNITDNEIREIQQVAEKYLTRTMLNISPVIEGCPCEEGPMCTDQVYVVPYANEKVSSLQMSKVGNVWQVGVVQQWWTRYDALNAQLWKMDYREFSRAESELLREFPVCVGELVPAATIASGPKAETKK